MADLAPFRYDAASLLALGQRDRQEDALQAHFPQGAGLGYAVLADGMGGHAGGAEASGIVVQAVLEDLAERAGEPLLFELDAATILREAALRANDALARAVRARPELRGMGATLVVPLVVGNRLYWISVGDSPLYLVRGDRMVRLNADHSVAGKVDRMAREGLISAEEAEAAEDRECLTSVLLGLPIPEIDLRETPVALIPGDIVIAASDGILFLDEGEIATLVHDLADRPAAEIASGILAALAALDDPDQDNVAVCVMKIARAAVQARPAASEADPARAEPSADAGAEVPVAAAAAAAASAGVAPRRVLRTSLRLRAETAHRGIAHDVTYLGEA